MTQATYRHDLGSGAYLDAYSLDPSLDRDRLAEIVRTTDGKANQDLASLANSIIPTEHISLLDLRLEIQEGNYQVPEPLRAYREAIQRDWDSKGRFNGPVLIATGEIENPLRVIQGGYYDFAATKLSDEPGKLVPDVYPPGKTVEKILTENGFSADDRARYFGLAHLMWPSDGNEFLLVQRAKGMGIAPDCVATPGSTPDLVLNKPGLKKRGFGVREYWSYHMAEEMKDEFKLKWGDFYLGSMVLFDDKKSIPFGAVDIHTKLSSEEIARGAFGDPRVLKEHTIVYSMSPNTIPLFLERFPIFPSVARAMDYTTKI